MTAAKWNREGDVVSNLIERKGFTRTEIAAKLKVSADVVDNICSGRTRLKGPRLKEMAYILDLAEGQLRALLVASETYPPDTPRLPVVTKFEPATDTVTIRGGKIVVVPNGKRAIPIYGSVTAGSPGRTFSDAQDVEFMLDWPAPFERWGRNIEGSSMEPEFRPGDIAIFENRRARANQAVYAVKDGEDCFKVLREDPAGQGTFYPLNPEGHTPFPATGWEVLGVLTARIRYGANGLRDQRDYPVDFTFRPNWKPEE